MDSPNGATGHSARMLPSEHRTNTCEQAYLSDLISMYYASSVIADAQKHQPSCMAMLIKQMDEGSARTTLQRWYMAAPHRKLLPIMGRPNEKATAWSCGLLDRPKDLHCKSEDFCALCLSMHDAQWLTQQFMHACHCHDVPSTLVQ